MQRDVSVMIPQFRPGYWKSHAGRIQHVAEAQARQKGRA